MTFIDKLKDFFISEEIFNASFIIKSSTQFLIWLSIFSLFVLFFRYTQNGDIKSMAFLGIFFYGSYLLFIIIHICCVFQNTFNKWDSTFFFLLFSIIPLLLLFYLCLSQGILLVTYIENTLNI